MFKPATIAVALAVFGISAQGTALAESSLDHRAAAASPGPARPAPHTSPNVRAAGYGVNAAATGTYASQAFRGGEYQGASVASFWSTGTTFGCMALSPIVAGALVNANEHRQLTSREVHVMLADCAVPFVGAWLMGKYWDSIEARRRTPAGVQHANAAPAVARVKR